MKKNTPHSNHISLRRNPVCPFGRLKWNKYFWVYPRKEPEYESDYWGTVKDPDGKARNLFNEWDQQVKNLSHVTDFLKTIKPGRILDVGCGPGFLLSALNGKWEKFGADVSRTALESCGRFAKTYHGDLPKLKLKTGSFDVVVMNHVIEHLSDPLRYVSEVRRILKKDGVFIVATPDFDSACARRFGKNFRMLHDNGHISLFTSFSLVKLLEDFGFDVLHVEYPFFETMWFTRANLNRMFEAEKISPAFYGSHVVVYARKRNKSRVPA